MTTKDKDTNMHFNACDIDKMDTRYRANFINALSGFKSANLIGSINKSGQHNLAIVSSVFHIGAHPPLMGMIMRPHTVPRDTLQNIKDTGVYTINHVNVNHVAQAHHTSARFDEGVSEFEQVGLTPWFSPTHRAPFVAESNIKIALAVQDIQLLALNQTELVIGQVVEVIVDETAIAVDGYIDIEQLNSAAISGLDSYHATSRIARYGYAKPDEPLKIISTIKY
jgi:flavin reductase (DIM6/NTAB) family NADH-FMN oxidoreductase RutF